MKFLTEGELAIVKKDFNEIWHIRTVRATLLMMPTVLVVVLPLVYLLMILFVPSTQMNGVEQMLKLLPPEWLGVFDTKQSMFYLMVNVVCPMFFLMIPLMVSTTTAAASFVGEKERGTIETLLLTPLPVRSLFKAKVTGCTLISALITAVSFLAFSIVVGGSNLYLGMPFFLNWNWLALVLVLSPAVTVFGVIFMVLVSGRSSSYIESMQLSGYVVLPLVLLMIGQFTGVIHLKALYLFLGGLAILVLDIVLLMVSSRRFTPEKLLKK